MKKVFVSGCYDILHAGHIQFFKEAKALGDHLTVCFASEKVLELAKNRKSAIPEDHKKIVMGSLSCVDEVLISSDLHPIFDFETHIKRVKPNILAVTEDDKNKDIKREFCAKYDIELVVLPKTEPIAKPVSTTSIRAGLLNLLEVPLRVDFAGGWLDVPKFSRKGAFIVNCTITPKVSLNDWKYKHNSGLGGSAAYSILQIKGGVASELNMGVGWQDPAVILETGLCVWRSGKKPVLESKYNPDWLEGKMLIFWMEKIRSSSDYVKNKRNFNKIEQAGKIAADAVSKKNLNLLAKAIKTSYEVQLDEKMIELPNIKGSIAKKYLGAGHGGYALYLFKNKKDRDLALKKNKEAFKVEPYIKTGNELVN